VRREQMHHAERVVEVAQRVGEARIALAHHVVETIGRKRATKLGSVHRLSFGSGTHDAVAVCFLLAHGGDDRIVHQVLNVAHMIVCLIEM
jgi:hypothetical protein